MRFAVVVDPEGGPSEAALREKATHFATELDALCKQHGFALEHEDYHGAFVLAQRSERESGFHGLVVVSDKTAEIPF